MKKFALILACSALGGLLIVMSYPRVGDALPSAPKIETSGPSLLVKDDKKKKKKDANKKSKKDDTSGLSECTIQQPGSGGGCKGGFKQVCEKLKSGKKCCGCVVDKNAPPPEKCKFPGEVGTPPNCTCPEGTELVGDKGCKTVSFQCSTASVVKKDGGFLGEGFSYGFFAPNETAARAKFFQRVDEKGLKVNAPVTCTKGHAN